MMICKRINNVIVFLVSMFAVCNTACTKDGLEIIELNDVNTEETLTQIIDSRVQIFDIKYADDWLAFRLKKEIIKIRTKTLPFISIDKQGNWVVNGKRISNDKVGQLRDNMKFPTISVSQNGYMLIDGCKSHFKWNDNSLDAIISRDTRIFAVAEVDSYLCFYYTDDNNIIIPIADSSDYIIPEYFFDNVVEEEKLSEETVKDVSVNDKYRYVFFTDAHWGRNQKHSPAIIKHIVDYSGIDRVIYGGDANTSRTETVQGTLDIGFQFKQAFSFLGHQMLALFGNHDDNSTGQLSLTDRHLSEEQVYSYLQSQMTDVCYWDYYNFYYDDLITKTRFICLDTGRFYQSSFLIKLPRTAQFVIECLSSVPDDWHIIVASHIWLKLKNFDTGEAEESPVIRPIVEILENYNFRLKSEFSYDGDVIPYDFSTAGATVEYCIGGHIHADAVVYSKKGIPLITVTCDGQQEVAGGLPYETGTINEQSVSIVVNDYQNKEVGVYRIGRGSDMKVKMWNSIGSI